MVAEYRFRWLSCIFIPVDKLKLLHHPDVLQSSAIANSLIQRLFQDLVVFARVVQSVLYLDILNC